ncbi:hypothetical protein AB0E88_12675 [Streptomyces sp. NPDC028635]|uniref:hypothetical protein n=1 Tax=Streptomyces sp. NPDC028635 TaxID=3154800 RepID=UPI0033FCDAB8
MSPFLDSLKKPSQQEPAPAGEVRPLHRRRRRLVLVVLAVLVVVVGVLLTPAARRELRESFTQMPASYSELYFMSVPAVRHDQVVTQVAVIRHGVDTGPYRLRAWLESPAGRTTASATTTLTEQPDGRMSVIVRLPLRPGSQLVRVALVGHRESLHFRLSPSSFETPKSSP